MIYALDILHRAGNLITGSRKKKHGDVLENHRNISRLWNAYLHNQLSKPITPQQVCDLMGLLKVARKETGDYDIDNTLDAVGYFALSGQLESKLFEEDSE
jgi:hypothetical protein